MGDGLFDTNPSDNILTVTRRGDPYYVITAFLNSTSNGDFVPLQSPVFGFCLGSDSDIDDCSARFGFPANGPTAIDPDSGSPGAPVSITVDRHIAVGAPFMLRLPPTGIQESVSVDIISARQYFPNAYLTLAGNGFELPACGLELYVFMKPPGPGTQVPMIRRNKRFRNTGGVSVANQEFLVGFAHSMGRRHVYVEMRPESVADNTYTGILRIYQARTHANAPGDLILDLIFERTVSYAPGVPPDPPQHFYEGELRGADQVIVTWEISAVQPGPSTVQTAIEVRD